MDEAVRGVERLYTYRERSLRGRCPPLDDLRKQISNGGRRQSCALSAAAMRALPVRKEKLQR